MAYESPGGAFSNAIESVLMQRAALAHQTLLDQLAQQKEANTNKWHEDEVAARKEEAGARRADLLERANERDRTDFEKRVSGMLPGDVPDAELLAKDAKFKTGFFKSNPKPPVEPMKDTTTMSGMVSQGEPGAPQQPPMAAGTPQTPPEPPASIAAPAPEGSVYLGNRQDRLKAQQDTKASAIIARLKNLEPGSPEFRQAVLEHESLTGKNVSAEFSKAPKTKSRYIFDPVKKVYTDTAGHVVTDLPDDAVVDRSAEPKGDAGGDAKAATQLQHAYDGAVKEILDKAKPIQGHIDGINELGTMLNAKTPAADTLIAPLVLKATVSGQGSGFRMTRAEIENVVGGRSKWESLSAALNKWSVDPTKALSITDEQRSELRDLAKQIRVSANREMQKILKARHELDDATEPSEIKKIRTRLAEDMAGQNDDATTTPAPIVVPPGVTVTKRK